MLYTKLVNYWDKYTVYLDNINIFQYLNLKYVKRDGDLFEALMCNMFEEWAMES